MLPCLVRARGDNRADSDIDIMIEIAPEIVQDVYGYVKLKNFIAALFTDQVDVVDRGALKSYVRPPRKVMPSMPSKSSEPEKRLLHIRDNIYLARKFVEGLDYEAFNDNYLVFYAVTRCLEIISEASRRPPDEMKARHPDIPWAEMAGAGNIYRHDYEDVQQRLVWGTVHRRFALLLAAVELELARSGPLTRTESKDGS